MAKLIIPKKKQIDGGMPNLDMNSYWRFAAVFDSAPHMKNHLNNFYLPKTIA